jgi:hypothetical protein
VKNFIDTLLVFPYNGFNFWETTTMTKQQFEMLMIYSGMLQDGTSSEGAIAYIMLMDYDTTDVAWLIKKVGATKKSELYKDARQRKEAKNRLNKVLGT